MAEFCKQCSEDIFGRDFGDLANLSRPIDTLFSRYPVVVCEGCGVTQVNHKGFCIHHVQERHCE